MEGESTPKGYLKGYLGHFKGHSASRAPFFSKPRCVLINYFGKSGLKTFIGVVFVVLLVCDETLTSTKTCHLRFGDFLGWASHGETSDDSEARGVVPSTMRGHLAVLGRILGLEKGLRGPMLKF